METHVMETHVMETHVMETHDMETHVMETTKIVSCYSCNAYMLTCSIIFNTLNPAAICLLCVVSLIVSIYESNVS